MNARYKRGFQDGKNRTTKFDIMCNHARYSDELKLILKEEEDQFKFTILRNPTTLVKSSFSYFFQGTPAFEAAGTFESFIENPDKWWKNSSKNKMYWFAKNGMSYDLGWTGDDYRGAQTENYFDALSEEEKSLKIQEFIGNMDEIFDFVMITEYMDYGVLILKKMLNLSYDDIVYMTVNKNMKNDEGKKAEKDSEQNSEEKSQKSSGKNSENKPRKVHDFQESYAENFASVDNALYNHFNKTFWQTVELYEITEADVAYFQNHRETVFKRCFRQPVVFNRRQMYLTGNKMQVIDREFHPWVQPGSKIMVYTFTERGEKSEFCRSLVRPELSFAQRIRVKQDLPMDGKMLMDGFYNLLQSNDKLYGDRSRVIHSMAEVMRLPDIYNITFQ